METDLVPTALWVMNIELIKNRLKKTLSRV